MEQKHSGLGIASFIISLVIAVVTFFLLLVAGIMESATPNGMDEKSAGAIVLGLFIIGGIIADLVALGLGICGLFQKDRKKIFSMLGTIFSAVTIVGVILLMIIGVMIK